MIELRCNCNDNWWPAHKKENVKMTVPAKRCARCNLNMWYFAPIKTPKGNESLNEL